MKQRQLGQTGLRVSRLGLGTLTWGTLTDEHEAADELRAFVDAGGTLVDTSPSYGGGASEDIVAKVLAGGVARTDVVLSTTAGRVLRDGQPAIDASRRSLLQTLDASMARLGVDHVDLWKVDGWADDVPLEETMSALDAAVTSGRARYVGVGGYAGWQIGSAATHQRSVPGRTRLAATQVEYSLLDRGIEPEIVPAAQALGLGILVWAPLGRGVLTGKYREGIPADSRATTGQFQRYVGARLDARSQQVAEAVCRAAEGLDLSPTQVALAWVRDRPGVVAPIVGARTAAQLQGALGAEEVALPTEITDALGDVSSGVEPESNSQ